MRSTHTLLRILVVVGAVVAFSLASANPAAAQDPIPRDSVRVWIARYHPGIAAGDTTHNRVGFSLDELGNVVATTVGDDPQLNERLASIRATRERLRGGDRQGAADVVIHGRGSGTVADRSPSPTRSFIAALHLPGTTIQSVDNANHEAAEVAPGPLEVLVVRLKRGE